NVSPDSLTELLDSARFGRLTDLSLRTNPHLGDETAALVARSAVAPRLKRLVLSECSIGPVGVRALLEDDRLAAPGSRPPSGGGGGPAGGGDRCRPDRRELPGAGRTAGTPPRPPGDRGRGGRRAGRVAVPAEPPSARPERQPHRPAGTGGPRWRTAGP